MNNNCCYACHWTKPGPEEGTWVPSCADAACKCHKEEVAAPKASGWEEEFKKKFVVKSNAGTGLLRYTDADDIKHFIRAKIAEERTTLLEGVRGRIEKMRRKNVPEDSFIAHRNEDINGWNAALDDLAKALGEDSNSGA